MIKRKKTKFLLASLGVVALIPAISIPTIVFNKNANNIEYRQYINEINNIELKVNTNAKKELPYLINQNNVNQYISNLPKIPNGLKVKYLFQFDDLKGILKLTIEITNQNMNSMKSKVKIITGFENTIEEYINIINNTKLVTNAGTSYVPISSIIYNNTIKWYIQNLPPEPKDFNLYYWISNINEEKGTLTLTICAAQGTNILISKPQKISGFLALDTIEGV